MEEQLFTFTIFTENQVGILSQISNIFTRRCLNIESLSVSPSSIKGVSKFTLTCFSNRDMMERVCKQIDKRIDVLKVYLLTDDDLVYQEIALYKVPTDALLDNSVVEAITRRHNASILEITRTYVVFEKTGHPEEIEALFDELKQFDINQFVRSGRVAVTKSRRELLDRYLEQQEIRRAQIESIR